MINTAALSIPDHPRIDKTYFLSKSIVAVELVLRHGNLRLGPIRQLPAGACVERCGDGFNERTVKVRYGGWYYFALLEDLECAERAGARFAPEPDVH